APLHWAYARCNAQAQSSMPPAAFNPVFYRSLCRSLSGAPLFFLQGDCGFDLLYLLRKQCQGVEAEVSENVADHQDAPAAPAASCLDNFKVCHSCRVCMVRASDRYHAPVV